MNKRRRAYKKYDWHNHCMQLMSDQLKEFVVKANSCAIEIAILYGKDAIGWKSEELVLQAGLWRIVAPVAVPYRKGKENDKS